MEIVGTSRWAPSAESTCAWTPHSAFNSCTAILGRIPSPSADLWSQPWRPRVRGEIVADRKAFTNPITLDEMHRASQQAHDAPFLRGLER